MKRRRGGHRRASSALTQISPRAGSSIPDSDWPAARAGAPGAPTLRDGQSLSGLLLPARGEIWVNAGEARQWPPRRRFTIGHELGHWVMHRSGQQSLFCRRTTVDEAVVLPARDIEEEASAFAAALLMPQWLFVREHARCGGDVATLCATFGSSIAATERRIASLF